MNSDRRHELLELDSYFIKLTRDSFLKLGFTAEYTPISMEDFRDQLAKWFKVGADIVKAAYQNEN